MDLQDIWQEHRRFILGVLGGLIVFLIAKSTITGLFDATGSVRAATTSAVVGKPVFDAQARTELQRRNEALTAEFDRLRDSVAFVPGEEFELAGKGAFDTYFPQVERRVRTTILQAAQAGGVELADQDLVWPAPSSREEVAATLVALAAMEQAALRLFDAGESVLAVDPEALGVSTVESLKYESRTSSRARLGGARLGRGSDEVELVEERLVSFVVRCDLKTLQVWFEALRGQNPPLALQPGLMVKQGEQVGDPLTVRGTLAVLTVKDPTQS